MKKTVGMMMVLTTALFFAGCAGNAVPNGDMEEIERSLEVKTQDEVAKKYVEDDEKSDNVSEQPEPTEDKESALPILSEEEFAQLRLIAEEYYASLNYKMLDLTPADPESSFHQEYEGYRPDEVVLFEVSVENIESKRYITIGSKDNWKNCEILNEGY